VLVKQRADPAAESGSAVDVRSIDWPQVSSIVYQVRQHYRYSYPEPVWDLKQRLVMIPPDEHFGQRLLEHRLEVRGTSGDCRLEWSADRFGNRVARVLAERVPQAVGFEAQYQVERRPPGRCGAAPLADLELYREQTPLTAPDRHIEAAAQAIAAESPDPRRLAERAHDWAAAAIQYQLGVTGVQTPAAMALHLGRGVCQDYAHLMLSVVRQLGLPARYVSGHLLGEGAPHAWVEVLLADQAATDGGAVVAYDPTHHRQVSLSYITVAVGRDFADVTPTSGYFSGPGGGQLHWNKQASVLEVRYTQGGNAPVAAA
jgi:transglutaminase-like putative cysteine protease